MRRAENAWEKKKLVDVATMQRGFDLPTQNRIGGDVPIVSSSGISDSHNKSVVQGPGVATGRSGSIGNVFYIEKDFWPLNTVLYVKDFHGNDPRFIFHLLNNFDLKRFASGSGVPTLNRNFFHDEYVTIPPLLEQKQIVRILDEAFEAIATAKANAEKNLQNARALFESHLQAVFSQRGEGWIEKPIAECFKVRSGDFLPSKAMVTSGNFDVYGGNGVNGKHTEYNLSGDNIIIGRVGEKCGNVHRAGGNIWVTDNAFFVSEYFEKFDTKFLSRLLKSKKLRDTANQAAQPVISYSTIKNVLLNFPILIQHQKAIAEKICGFELEIEAVESVYQRKLSAFDALKKSLLHRAFSGQLTSSLPQTLIPFPTKVPDIAPTDLHAGILAIAYQFHEAWGNLENYGHVKAEKIAHMVEAHLGIDLERAPIKDAAGPNDHPHSRKVEHRARLAGYFDFHRVESGAYQVKKLPGFDKLILRTREKLGDRLQSVIHLITRMVGMTPRQAEIFATVYAAWNNLLLDGKSATDEDIVTEARENWHPAKMDIPRDKFFKAIGWIRDRNLIPKGMGKRVAAKA